MGLCRLDLRPPSCWRVLLAVLVTAARYGDQRSRQSVDDLSRMTGLAHRTVKGAVAELVRRKLLARVGRYERYQVGHLTSHAIPRGASLPVPPTKNRDGARGTDKPAPRTYRQACTSPTSIILSSSCREKECDPGTFTPKQERLIAEVFVEATALLGSEVTELVMPEAFAKRLCFPAPVTYGEARNRVAHSGDPVKARHYTCAVLALRRDERVQGQELTQTKGGRLPDLPIGSRPGLRRRV
jgi:hypothetical protein